MAKITLSNFRKSLLVFFVYILSGWNVNAYASGPSLRINEISAGSNGNSKVQFIEIVTESETDKQWGPGESEYVGRVMLTFYGPSDAQVGRYVFGGDAPLGQDTVLIATEDFVVENGSVVPDFIMPPLVSVNSGKLCISSNIDNPVYSFQQCVTYGGIGFKGDTNGLPANANTVSSLNRSSLSLIQNFESYDIVNTDFALGTETPSGTRSNGESVSLKKNEVGSASQPNIESNQIQGRNLFFNETFGGNSRTCSSCHFESDAFGLNPETVSKLPDDNPLFVHEKNVNRLTIDGVGSVNPNASTAQPSDLRVGDTITGSLGGSATVLSGTGNTYLIIGGDGLNISNNVIQDSYGNTGTIRSFVQGDLNRPGPNGDRFGLESPIHLRGPRALIVANVNGFDRPANLRGVPSLVGSRSGRSTGQSGTDHGPRLSRDEFNTIAVKQHLTRSLTRTEGLDFRLPNQLELNALDSFIEGLLPQVFTEPPKDVFERDSSVEFFASTQQQIRGLNLFHSRCDGCHSGISGAGTSGLFNTRVATLEVNSLDNIPAEQDIGAIPNSRTFRVRNLINLEKSAPYFHDNSVATLEDAIRFYETENFTGNSNTVRVFDDDQNVADIAALLKNIRPQPFRVSKRILRFERINIDKGNAPPLSFELTNTGDAPILVENIHLVQDLTRTSLNFDTRLDYSYTNNLTDSKAIDVGESVSFELIFNPDDSITHTFTSLASLEFDLIQGDEKYEAGVLLTGARDRVLDSDKDGVDYPLDNCEMEYNPSQANIDNDRFGDACDFDPDGDGFGNDIDVCKFIADPDQLDLDSDGQGDACDLDDDDDGIPDTWEIRYGLNPRLSEDALLDSDGDGFTNLAEFEFATNPRKFNNDDNNNGIPDITDQRRRVSKIVPLILSILNE